MGYSCYYLTRNSLTFTAPAMVASPSLGLDITSIGVITSIFPLCYGCSKFVSGVVGDVLSPSVMLGGGLIATGLVRRPAQRCFSHASPTLEVNRSPSSDSSS